MFTFPPFRGRSYYLKLRRRECAPQSSLERGTLAVNDTASRCSCSRAPPAVSSWALAIRAQRGSAAFADLPPRRSSPLRRTRLMVMSSRSLKTPHLAPPFRLGPLPPCGFPSSGGGPECGPGFTGGYRECVGRRTSGSGSNECAVRTRSGSFSQRIERVRSQTDG